MLTLARGHLPQTYEKFERTMIGILRSKANMEQFVKECFLLNDFLKGMKFRLSVCRRLLMMFINSHYLGSMYIYNCDCQAPARNYENLEEMVEKTMKYDNLYKEIKSRIYHRFIK
jgi:hypothetical protein